LGGEPLSSEECAKIDRNTIDGKLKDAEKIKVGYFLTEFGDVYQTPTDIEELNTITSYAES